jgi:hypothetical protein
MLAAHSQADLSLESVALFAAVPDARPVGFRPSNGGDRLQYVFGWIRSWPKRSSLFVEVTSISVQ